MTHSVKLNFVRAYATYCAYCVACHVKPETVKQFASDWKVNKQSDHANCNYDYRDPEVIRTILRKVGLA